ncbi:glycoside hydrolase superfamily [Zopfochytrium polystomum]|nr:glycoside hydrolase superfamily [Zopfochytrium polystomum]
MRYLPEFNGEWMLYGGKPTAFVANWKMMAATMRSTAPNVKLVWSPNFDLNTRGDNAGSMPYWPGEENVDIVGTSQYWKSSQKAINSGGPFTGNVAPGATFFSDSITYVYNTYAKAFNKPFIISEASAAWESTSSVQYTNSVTQPELQFDFWTQIFTAFTSGNFPLLSMAQIFEYDKFEDAYQRDFRVTWDDATRQRFLDALQTLISTNKITWANGGSSGTPTGTTSATKAPSTSTSAVVSPTTSTKSSADAKLWLVGSFVGSCVMTVLTTML